MKKLVFFALLLAFLLCACGGRVDNVKLDIGESDMYTEEEIRSAMYVVFDFFEKEMDHCTLNKLVYNESATANASLEWAAQYGADQAIVLYSDFDTDPHKALQSLGSGANYSWKWVLTRSINGKWELQTWGYG